MLTGQPPDQPTIVSTSGRPGVNGPEAESLMHEASYLWTRISGGLPASKVNHLRVGICSTHHGEGVTSVAANFAVFMSQQGRATGLVEGNLRTPSLAEYFGVPATPGVWEFIDEVAGETEILHEIDRNLDVVPAGIAPRAFAAEFDADRIGQLIDFVDDHHAITVVDCPPLSSSPEAGLLLHNVDTVVLVAQAGRVKRADIQRSVRTIDELRVPFAGIVLNAVNYDVPSLIAQYL